MGAGAQQSADPGLIERLLSSLFGPSRAGAGSIQSQPLAPPAGYESQPSWSPPSEPPILRGKPATKLSSADALRQRISGMIGMPQEPPGDPYAAFSPANAYGPQLEPNPPVDPYGEVPPVSARDFSYGGLPIPPRPARPVAAGLSNGWFGPRRAMGGGFENGPGYFSTGGGSNYVSPDGMGDGRSDHVEARLSPGEYVIDAETVSLLGNGDNDAGARSLDLMREAIRKQKGKKLARGEFSPDAKPAHTYLKDGD